MPYPSMIHISGIDIKKLRFYIFILIIIILILNPISLRQHMQIQNVDLIIAVHICNLCCCPVCRCGVLTVIVSYYCKISYIYDTIVVYIS